MSWIHGRGQPEVTPNMLLRRHNRLDRISSMPEDITLHILSFLDMKESGRTSVLSQRWRNIWTKLVDLSFHVPNIFIANNMKLNIFVEWVNQVIAHHRAPHINTFSVKCLLNKTYSTHIDKWLQFAVQKGVRNLELDFSSPSNNYTPNFLFLFSFPGFALFKTQLQSLTLVGVNIRGYWLEFILSNCQNLECLSVERSTILSRLKIVGRSSLKLKQLVIHHCFELNTLEIFSNNLTSLSIWGREIDVEYRNVPSLVEADFGGPYGSYLVRNFHYLSTISSQLEKLSLFLTKMVSLPIGVTTFTNIKTLEMGVLLIDGDSLLFLTSYLEACPFLHKFVLKFIWSTKSCFLTTPRVEIAWKEPICTHKHLKVVEFVGFIGSISDVELVLYIINKYALKLEKIIFNPRKPRGIGFFHQKEDELREPRRRAVQLVGRLQLPSRVDVVII